MVKNIFFLRKERKMQTKLPFKGLNIHDTQSLKEEDCLEAHFASSYFLSLT